MVQGSLGPQARQWEAGSFNQRALACSCPDVRGGSRTHTGSIQMDIQRSRAQPHLLRGLSLPLIPGGLEV